MTDTPRSRRPLIGFTVGTRNDHLVNLLLRLAIRIGGGRAMRLVDPPDSITPPAPDGLLLGGGLDVHPARYSGDDAHVSDYDLDRDVLEWSWLKAANAAGLPVLGICRGLQVMNVHAGGDLLQTLDPEIAHGLPSGPLGYLLFRKPIRIEAGSHLAAATDCTALKVNSLHSQAVRQPAPGFAVVARDCAHGGIQAIESDAPALRLGVQYHPELLLHRPTARALFRYFVDRCRRTSARPPAG